MFGQIGSGAAAVGPDTTWGIGGATFMAAYLLVAAATMILTGRTRRALANPRPSGVRMSDLARRPYDVAYLNGGPELAVYSTLCSLHMAGAITSVPQGRAGAGEGAAGKSTEKGIVQAVGRPAETAERLERAVHRAAHGPTPRRRLVFQYSVAEALRDIDERLVAAGLLLPEAAQRRIRTVGYWTLAVAAFGLIRILAELSNGRTAGWLLLAVVAVGGVGVLQIAHAPRRTGVGGQTLRLLRARHHDLAPAMRPDWRVGGQVAAALSVALYGTPALWASDPELADRLAAERTPAVPRVPLEG